jgi:hypothetical protein
MKSLGAGDVFIWPSRLGDVKPEIIPLEKVGWTPSINRIRFRQDPNHGRSIYNQRYKSSGTELGSGVRVVSPDISQDICFDDVMGALLKDIEGKFRGALKRKIIADIKYTETMETALLSESALAKDWLTPEEDEAWKDL